MLQSKKQVSSTCSPKYNTISKNEVQGTIIRLNPGDVLFDINGDDITESFEYTREKFGVKAYVLPIGEYKIIVKYPYNDDPIYRIIKIVSSENYSPYVEYDFFKN